MKKLVLRTADCNSWSTYLKEIIGHSKLMSLTIQHCSLNDTAIWSLANMMPRYLLELNLGRNGVTQTTITSPTNRWMSS